jgi:protein kinase-like protein/FtsX-like permease family protein
MPIEQALNIAKNICEALEVAHDKGITHRDLKPANVKLTPDSKVKVLDFGLAKLTETTPSLTDAPMLVTGSRVIVGTAAYMSPEQAMGQSVDRRTDIFAFGCVLYEMLTGRRAFEGSDTVTAEPDWSQLPAQTPWLIQRVLRRALTKDPRQRLGDVVFTGFAVVMAFVGTYGLMAYIVALRMKEFGVRMAFGARGSAILRLVMIQSLRIVLPGVLLGLLASVGVSRFLSTLLFEIKATDPVVYGLLSIGLIVLALGAALIPAIRASRHNPVTLLSADRHL